MSNTATLGRPPRTSVLLLVAVLVSASACDSQRLDKLEKETQTLRADVQALKDQPKASLDSQAKCATDARAFFTREWSPDKDTTLLEQTNHYDAKRNRCFVLIEYHFRTGVHDDWANWMVLFDVYENKRYGRLMETFDIATDTGVKPSRTVSECVVVGAKCASLDEFNKLVRPFMTE